MLAGGVQWLLPGPMPSEDERSPGVTLSVLEVLSPVFPPARPGAGQGPPGSVPMGCSGTLTSCLGQKHSVWRRSGV